MMASEQAVHVCLGLTAVNGGLLRGLQLRVLLLRGFLLSVRVCGSVWEQSLQAFSLALE